MLDFGCGVGRLTRALARRFEIAVGVDIAASMIDAARQFNADIPNCTFRVNESSDLRKFPDGHFDAVFTYIVLQHMPDHATVKAYIREFLRVLASGGLLIFQLPCGANWRRRIQWRRRAYRLLRYLGLSPEFLYNRLKLIPMAMQIIPEREIVELLESIGATVLAVDPDMDAGPFASRTYYVSKI